MCFSFLLKPQLLLNFDHLKFCLFRLKKKNVCKHKYWRKKHANTGSKRAFSAKYSHQAYIGAKHLKTEKKLSKLKNLGLITVRSVLESGPWSMLGRMIRIRSSENLLSDPKTLQKNIKKTSYFELWNYGVRNQIRITKMSPRFTHKELDPDTCGDVVVPCEADV